MKKQSYDIDAWQRHLRLTDEDAMEALNEDEPGKKGFICQSNGKKGQKIHHFSSHKQIVKPHGPKYDSLVMRSSVPDAEQVEIIRKVDLSSLKP